MIQEGNKFVFDTDAVGELQDADIFLFTGPLRQDVEKGDVVICGQDYLHVYREKERRFETVKKLE
jgi:hypothetical protein